MVEKVVSVSNLVKNFGDSIAVNDISFDINKGDIVGLVGPDGAGKTTLIRLLVGLLKPTSGNISIFNLNPIDDTDKLHEIIG